MCLICVELIKHRMTTSEAKNAVKELITLSSEYLEKNNQMEHSKKLLKALEDFNLENLEAVIDEGTET